MSNAIIRRAREQDELMLKVVWDQVFDDDACLVKLFFELFFEPENCIVAEVDGIVRAAAYMLRGVRLLDGKGGERPAAYFYALAVHPDYRSRDLGTEVTRACISLARERGEVLCLFPADEDLRGWYAHMNGLRDLGRQDILYTNPRLCALPPKYQVRELSPAEYAQKREEMLAQRAHAALPESFFRFQKSLYEFMDAGALLELDIDGVKGLACAEKNFGSLDVKELLYPGHPKTAAAVLMKHFEADGCALYMPADETQGESTVMSDGVQEGMRDLWWGPMFN